jgi:hypothetical protein
MSTAHITPLHAAAQGPVVFLPDDGDACTPFTERHITGLLKLASPFQSPLFAMIADYLIEFCL